MKTLLPCAWHHQRRTNPLLNQQHPTGFPLGCAERATRTHGNILPALQAAASSGHAGEAAGSGHRLAQVPHPAEGSRTPNTEIPRDKQSSGRRGKQEISQQQRLGWGPSSHPGPFVPLLCQGMVCGATEQRDLGRLRLQGWARGAGLAGKRGRATSPDTASKCQTSEAQN